MALMNKPKEPRKTSKLEKKVKTLGRYTLSSFLPGKVQEEIAEKHGEDTLEYWAASTITEMVVGGGMAVVGVAFPPIAVSGLVLMGDCLVNAFRGFTYVKNPCGHPITTIPYHTGKYLKNKLSRKKK